MTELLSWQTEAEKVDDPVISCQGVTKQFGSHRVLDGVTYDVPRGQTTTILGPSGTGKSVMLKAIIGLLKPEAGQIVVDGEPVVGISEKNLLRIRRKFGVVFQDGALFGSMSLYDNIAFPMREHPLRRPRRHPLRRRGLGDAARQGLIHRAPSGHRRFVG